MEKLVADAIRFVDGSIIDFSEMLPPESGDILSGTPGENWIPRDQVENDTIAPASPSDLTISQDTNDSVAGSILTTTVTASWTPPTTNEDGSELVDLAGFFVIIGSSNMTVAPDVTSVKATGIPCDTDCQVMVAAFDKSGNQSSWLSDVVHTNPIPIPDDVANLIGSPLGALAGIASADAVNRPDMAGFVVCYRQHTSIEEQPAPPSNDSGWGDWSSEVFVACGTGVPLKSSIVIPIARRFTQFRAKACVHGGIRSNNWTLSNIFQISGVKDSDFSKTGLNDEIKRLVESGSVVLDNRGIVAKNGKFLLYSDDGASGVSFLRLGMQSGEPQVVAVDTSGNRALLGKSGDFWGLYIEGGAVLIKTAGDALQIDASGITLVDTEGRISTINQNGIHFEGAVIEGGMFTTGSSGPRVEISDASDNSFIRLIAGDGGLDPFYIKVFGDSFYNSVDIAGDGLSGLRLEYSLSDPDGVRGKTTMYARAASVSVDNANVTISAENSDDGNYPPTTIYGSIDISTQNGVIRLTSTGVQITGTNITIDGSTGVWLDSTTTYLNASNGTRGGGMHLISSGGDVCPVRLTGGAAYNYLYLDVYCEGAWRRLGGVTW